MAAGMLTSFNEALWVASSFFSPNVLEAKVYRVGQKLAALCALSQFIVIGAVSATVASISLLSFIAKGEHAFVRCCMCAPMLAFYVTVPVVQVPLLKGAWGRLQEAINTPDRKPE